MRGTIAGPKARGFLSRLARNRAGNTIVIMAIALIPITGLAGSAIDTSRMYFVKVRLQQACDAGALAGRKFMKGTDFDTNAHDRAVDFFNNNFKDGVFGSTNASFTPTKTADSQVHGDASVVVPMTLTKILGAEPATITVVCEAKLEIPNLDVMFVLDTTGSMNEINPGDTESKITALRASVTNFYNALEAAKQTGTQIRYGFVPYATNVNVGMLLKREWMADTWKYQSRKIDTYEEYEKTTTKNTKTTTTVQEAFKYESGSQTTTTWKEPGESCPLPANPNPYSSKDTVTPDKVEAHPEGDWTYQTRRRVLKGDQISVTASGGFCNYTKKSYDNYTTVQKEIVKPGPGTETTTTTVKNYWWLYDQWPFDVSAFKGNAPNGLMAGATNVKYPIGNNHGMANVTWNASNACIEERATVPDSSYNPIPTGAIDMDIDRVPTPGDVTTQWAPALAGLVYARNGVNNYTTAQVRTTSNFSNMNNATYAKCPSPARKLGAITKAQLKTYLDGLEVDGRTFHDIGFLWGARLISPTGIFASENATAPNGSDISRNIIFMTDGGTDTDLTQYEAYGLSPIDRRRTNGAPTNADQNTIVENRTLALCKAARAKNITVWVIAFGTDLTTMLTNCASQGRAYQADNADQLNTTFSNIAAQIAKLRVSK